jgi:ribose 5-phosphate isomerase A
VKIPLRDREVLKAAAAARAVEIVRPDMVIGLAPARRLAILSKAWAGWSARVWKCKRCRRHPPWPNLASSLGIVTTEDPAAPIDLAVDGADEIDPERRLIKGRGGALTREKLVAAAARTSVVIADDSKMVRRLGQGQLPVEILPFLWRQTEERLERAGAACRIRGKPSAPYITANGICFSTCVSRSPSSNRSRSTQNSRERWELWSMACFWAWPTRASWPARTGCG